MGYLLKEALKTLCGVNQWSYAVFWKFGCQNPKLLVWEECYYDPSSSCLGLPETGSLQHKVQARDKVHLLVNKMMMDSHVVISGEGLIGRVAFMGSHQWILSENYDKEAHPPEVLKELCRQFSAGMQTIAVIPVLPHGVIQFGSFLMIMENMGFVNDVTSLVLQLGLVPGVFPSENYAVKEQAAKIGIPACLENSTSRLNAATHLLESSNYVGYSGLQTMVDGQESFPFVEEMQNDLRTDVVAFQAVGSTPSHRPQETNIAWAPKPDFSSLNQSMFGVTKAQVIPSNPKMLINGNASPFNPSFCIASHSSMRFTEQRGLPDPGTSDMSASVLMPAVRNSGSIYSLNNGLGSRVSVDEHGLCRGVPGNMKPISYADSVWDVKRAADGNNSPKHLSSTEHSNMNFTKWEDPKSDSIVLLGANPLLAQNSNHLSMAEYNDAYAQPKSGDDLFDVLGQDYKNKVFSSCWNRLSSNESTSKMHSMDKHILLCKKSRACSDIYSTCQGNSDSGIFSSSGTDDLLEAVVSQNRPAKQRMDESVSCKTTLTSTSISSAPKTSLSYDQPEDLAIIKGKLFGVPKHLANAGATSSCSLQNVSCKEESGIHSQGSSLNGLQIRSWIENDRMAKQNNSVSTGHSRRPREMSKTNHKRRLKPGENPRPRPKDRQMIQDRVKELREIVPNGAKCSIDSLLERTIKHMLFLQSVMKHADKLKQSGESKIMSKDVGVTWAYEVCAQSMVCPIRVEDLNQPRQMLVEMLCEESGLFLEIADIIRGLGLTILKGIMETQDNKIWSRFTVEANRDVTRMEIFISLVRLLEQSAKPGVAQPNENLMAQQLKAPAVISPNLQ